MLWETNQAEFAEGELRMLCGSWCRVAAGASAACFLAVTAWRRLLVAGRVVVWVGCKKVHCRTCTWWGRRGKGKQQAMRGHKN